MGLKSFTIDQDYNCLHTRTVRVRAASLEAALIIANESDAYSDPIDGLVSCSEWSSDMGGGECGPTFTSYIAQGPNPRDDNAYSLITEKPACKREVPPELRQFATEWPAEHAKLLALAEALGAMLAAYSVPVIDGPRVAAKHKARTMAFAALQPLGA